MAINPDNITTIRVDQLNSIGLTLDSLFPHTNGTELTSSSIGDLATLVATTIESLNGIGFLPISVTDGQQLPDLPENPVFFLAGAGTYLNVNGFPDLICTENLNAIMSVTDHWEIAVEIPVNPLTGSVQSVTGSAVDNTDPLNPVINLSAGGVTSVNGDTGVVVVDLQSATDEGNTITDGTDTNSIGANGVGISDGVDYSSLTKTEVQITDLSETSTLNKGGLTVTDGTNSSQVINNSLVLSDGVTDTAYSKDEINHDGVSYPLPTGASSPLATLADITGGSGGYTVVSSNQTAVNDTNYTVVANATFTDPSPTEGKGYVVYVRNGTATIGGTGYAVGSLVFRVFHSGSWSTREYKSNLTASDIPSGIDATKIADGSVSNTEFQYINSLTSNAQTQLDIKVDTLLNDNVDSSSVTGTVANTIIKSYLIPANTLVVGDTIDLKTVCSKTGTNANCNFRLYTNTSNSLTGASALAMVTPTSTNLYFSLDRTYTLKSGNTLESFPVTGTTVTDESPSTLAISNTAFNPAVDNYFIIAIQPNNASDSFKQTLCYITRMKQKTTI